MAMWPKSILNLVALVTVVALSSGCSSMHGGISVGQYTPVQSDVSGGTMYGFDVHAKVNDKWRAGVELHQLKDFGGDSYSFVKTYTGPFGSSTPTTSTISMTTLLYGVQYYLKNYLVLDVAAGEMRAQVNNQSFLYAYDAPIGDKLPSGTLFKLSLLYTTKKSGAYLFPYIGVGYLYMDLDGALTNADSSRVVFRDSSVFGQMLGVML